MRIWTTYNTVDELDVTGALRVAVARTELGTSLVGGEPGHTAILVHSAEVERAVETAGEVRHVNIEGELLVEQLEHRVPRLAVHEVHARADVGAGDELERERSARGGDTVGALVVRTIEGAVCRASLAVGAERRVPLVAGVAVGVARGAVQPAPVGVEHDSGVLGGAAAAGRALLGSEAGVVLGRVRADLLAVHDSREGEGEER